RECGEGRFISGISFRRSRIRPIFDERDLVIGQASFVGKVSVSGFRFPWRHVSAPCNGGKEFCPLRCILIAEQREGRDFTRTMATGAVLIKDRRNVLIKGRSGGRTGYRGEQ